MEDIVEKCIIYSMLINKKKNKKHKRKTNFSITTLNIMNKNDVKNMCPDFGIVTGNLKKTI